jgi:hypothetical protein
MGISVSWLITNWGKLLADNKVSHASYLESVTNIDLVRLRRIELETKRDTRSVERTVPFTIYRAGFPSIPASIPTARALGTAIPVEFVCSRYIQHVPVELRITEVVIPSAAASRLPWSPFILRDGLPFIICIPFPLIVVTTRVVELDVSIEEISVTSSS